MMRIIRTTPDSNGAYPALQMWGEPLAPPGYAVWPDSLEDATFNAYSGFVVLDIRRGYVSGYEANQEAYDAWTPAPEPDPPTPSGGGADQVYEEIAAAIREGVNSI